MTYTRMCSRKMLGFSLSDYVHSPRAQALPSNFSSSQPEGLIIPPNPLSFSLRNSCSNELNHTSDAAEDHDHGYELFATELLNSLPFLLSDSTRLLSTSSPSYTNRFFYSKKRQSFTAPLLLPFTSTHYPFLTIFFFFCTPELSSTSDTQNPRLPPSYLVRFSSPIALSSSSRFQTAILHKCSTIPNHNSEPPSRLHAHSMQPSQILNQGTTHADVMQRRPSQT
jgi:hypothetical protein